jgi:hypothetical protein
MVRTENKFSFLTEALWTIMKIDIAIANIETCILIFSRI